VRGAFRLGLWLTVLAGCGPGEAPCRTDRVVLAVTDAAGDLPAEYQATFTWGTAAPAGVLCPGGGGGPASCSGTGATLEASPTSVLAVVKARGHRTLLLDQGLACDLPEERIDAALTALPAFVSNDDYATGFMREGGDAEFERLAVTVPGESGETRVVKFLITGLPDRPEVYFQHTSRHPLHYAFARQVLGQAVSQAEFLALTYTGEDRANMAGSIVLYPDRSLASAAAGAEVHVPYTIEFFPSDDLSPRLALLAHRLLEERLGQLSLGGTSRRLFYVPPTAAHEEALRAADRDFQSQSALWLTRAELFGDVTVQYLNPGKGCGTVHRLTPEQLASTPLSFRDLVVLTRLPNEVPLVAGTITEELQTPLAHVNVAARARGTPNLALLNAGSDARVEPFLDRLACLEVRAGSFSLYSVTLEEAQAFWDTLIPPEPVVPVADLETTGLLAFADIGFEDAIRVGVKAANVAELSHLIPDHAPDGFAVPFSWYHRHMEAARFDATACGDAQRDCLAGGRPAEVCGSAAALCTAGAADGLSLTGYVDRLLDDSGFQTSTALAEAALAGLRYLIETSTVDPAFATLLDGEVRARWGTAIKVKLRSSTNSEDLPNFSGAGLYSSYSSQLGTAKPPSAQIRKTWASVWNFAAYQERAFWNIDHRAVMMGVAVHPSYPEEDCNGVLITQSIANPAVSGCYVNVQLGELAVTNPEDGILPEIFTALPAGDGVLVLRDRYSSLSPGVPLMSEPEIAELYAEAMTVQAHFAALYHADRNTFALDLEFKRVPPGRRLVIKQVRPYLTRAAP
jgi:hypothetical protein